MFNDFFFRYRAVYDTMWRNAIEPDRSQMIMWRMRIADWICKATNTRSEYVIFVNFPQQQWLNENPSVLRSTYFARFVFEFV
jgi:hypothetical protein